MADAIASALRADPGSVLAFLPGAAEIRRTQNFLGERVQDASIEIVPLFGALDAAVQDRAIAPAPKGSRKVVLATSIAETSLTIEGVRIVVDSGLARVPRYEPDIGLTRLETVRASRAAVDQRRGRAGRTEPGVCYRLWDEPQTASLAAYTQPEILSADLSSLVLDLAQWGVSDPATLAFLDPPPAPALKEARSLLRELGALDGDGRITAEGKSLRALALPPRLARMIVDSHRARRGRRGRRDRRHPHRARARRRQRRSRSTARSVPPRPLARAPRSARDLARRWASQVAASREGAATRARMLFDRRDARLCLSRSRRAQPRQWQLRARQRPRRRGGADLGAGARALYRGRRADRHGGERAHPARRADHARPTSSGISPTRSRPPTRSPSIAARWRLRARRKRTLHAITLSEAPLALSPSADTARILADGLIAAGLDQLPWSKACQAMARPRDVPAQGRRRAAGPICPMTRSRRGATTGWCRRSTTRPR